MLAVMGVTNHKKTIRDLKTRKLLMADDEAEYYVPRPLCQ